jgi:hypothetical protein
VSVCWRACVCVRLSVWACVCVECVCVRAVCVWALSVPSVYHLPPTYCLLICIFLIAQTDFRLQYKTRSTLYFACLLIVCASLFVRAISQPWARKACVFRSLFAMPSYCYRRQLSPSAMTESLADVKARIVSEMAERTEERVKYWEKRKE